jgi:hypothetical protein
MGVVALGVLNLVAVRVVDYLGDGFTQVWRWGIEPILMAFLFVGVGAWAAPKGKTKVALCLYVLAICVMTTSTLYRLALPEAHDLAWPLVSIACTILGGGSSVWFVKNGMPLGR